MYNKVINIIIQYIRNLCDIHDQWVRYEVRSNLWVGISHINRYIWRWNVLTVHCSWQLITWLSYIPIIVFLFRNKVTNLTLSWFFLSSLCTNNFTNACSLLGFSSTDSTIACTNARDPPPNTVLFVSVVL